MHPALRLRGVSCVIGRWKHSLCLGLFRQVKLYLDDAFEILKTVSIMFLFSHTNFLCMNLDGNINVTFAILHGYGVLILVLMKGQCENVYT